MIDSYPQRSPVPEYAKVRPFRDEEPSLAVWRAEGRLSDMAEGWRRAYEATGIVDPFQTPTDTRRLFGYKLRIIAPIYLWGPAIPIYLLRPAQETLGGGVAGRNRVFGRKTIGRRSQFNPSP